MKTSIQTPVSIHRELAEQASTSLFDFSAFLTHADTIAHTARTLLAHGETRAVIHQLEMLVSLAENVRPFEPHAYALWEAVEAADKAQGA